MSDNKVQTAGSGIGFGGLFFLVLFVLKVCGPLAAMSWWWVTAPLWIPIALILLVLLGAMALWGILALITGIVVCIAARKAKNKQ